MIPDEPKPLPRKTSSDLPQPAGQSSEQTLRTLPRNPGLRFWTLVRLSLHSTEYVMLAMLVIYTGLDLAFFRQVPSSLSILQSNILAGAGIIGVAVWHRQTGSRASLILRSFYIGPLIYIGYSQIHNYIMVANPSVWDYTLAAWDRAIFGVNPTQWFMKISTPALTEYLQLCYNLFYFIIAAPAVEFFVRKKMRAFRIYAMMLSFCFVISFLLYLVMPAIGPRFSVHDYYSIDTELPGLVLTGSLRALIDAGNAITPQAMKDPFHMINHDCMPSGHTMMSLIAMLMAWRLGSRMRWLNTVGGLSVIISTVYLRYHYGVDVLAGAALAILLVLLLPQILKFWKLLRVRL